MRALGALIAPDLCGPLQLLEQLQSSFRLSQRNKQVIMIVGGDCVYADTVLSKLCRDLGKKPDRFETRVNIQCDHFAREAEGQGGALRILAAQDCCDALRFSEGANRANAKIGE